MKGSIIKLIFGLVIAIPIAIAAVELFLTSRHYTKRSLRHYLFRMPKIKFAYIALTIVYGLGFFASSVFLAYPVANATVSLNYAEASRGKNMNGTRYNMSEIICDDVLERTIKKGALEDITVDDLKSTLSVAPSVQGSATKKENYHISTEFYISYAANSKTAHINEETLMSLLTDSYREYLIDNYAGGYEALDIKIDPENDFRDMSYFDIYRNLILKAEVVENYMYGLSNESNSFVSSDGSSFASVAAKVYKVKQERIVSTLYSLIVDKGLSKDPSSDISRLEYDNKLLEFDRMKSLASYNANTAAVNMYDKDMMRVVLVPSLDKDAEFYMSMTKLGLDNLTLAAVSSGETSAAYLKQIESNKNIIDSISKTAGLTVKSERSGFDATTDTTILEIVESIESLAVEASSVAREYGNSKMNGCISVTIGHDNILKKLVSCAFAAVLFFAAILVLKVVHSIPKANEIESELAVSEFDAKSENENPRDDRIG